MTEQHPITPPPERFNRWEDDILNERDNVDHVLDRAWRDGFRAGAARRPKPPSLADQALDAIDEEREDITLANYKVIRVALERLQRLENN